MANVDNPFLDLTRDLAKLSARNPEIEADDVVDFDDHTGAVQSFN